MNKSNQISNELNPLNVNEQFACLLLNNQKRIYGFILTLVPNMSDADDLMQETVMVMCRRFDEFDQEASFAAWGMGIAYNKVLKFRQKQSRSKLTFSEKSMDQIIKSSNDSLDILEDYSQALNNCLQKLNEHDRKLIRMRYKNSEKIKTIAQDLNRSVQGMYKVFARIHNTLRLCVDRTLTQKKGVS